MFVANKTHDHVGDPGPIKTPCYCVSMYSHICVHVSVTVCTHVYICLSVHICLHACECVHTCMCVLSMQTFDTGLGSHNSSS